MSENPEQTIRDSLGVTGGWESGELGAIEANEKVHELEKKISTDLLTGLEGEYPLHDMVSGLQTRWKNDYKKGDYLQGTFVVADLTGLHETNEKFGKLAGGNDYLKAVGEIVKKTARGSGRAFRAREGADEVILYLPGYKIKKEIENILNKMDSELEESEKDFQDKYPGIKFGLSYSIASFHRGYDPESAYTDANNKMSEAKKSRGNGRVGYVGRLFVNELKERNKKYE